jgi:hypothetical protein
MKWFSTLFLYSFPFGFCIRAWDCYLADGRDFIFRLALAICKMYEKELIKYEIQEANDFFNAFLGKETFDDEVSTASSST